MDSSGEKRTATLQSNPLLLNPVIECVFEHLPLEDIKQCRIVCQEWNSASMQILNKQSAVKLDSNDRMKNFLEFYKDGDNQAFPSTTFRLNFRHDGGHTEEYDQLIDLFNTLRENIIDLKFVVYGDKLSLNPLIELATNLVRLELSSDNFHSPVELDQLSKVKHISLYGCCVSLDSFKNRIAPLSISLRFVTFEKNEKNLEEILINDYIDFSRCSEIEIKLPRGFVFTFDMSRDIVSAQKVHFEELRVINWGPSLANVDKRMLSYKKQSGMGIKELDLKCSESNLSALPKSLEKLSLDTNTYIGSNFVPLELPHLKYLFFRSFDDTIPEIPPIADDMIIITSIFRLCPKLADMELCGSWANHCDINVDLLPVTLKRIKLSRNKKINLVGDTVIHVDSLILDPGTLADVQKFMTKIKPKIIVVELQWAGVVRPANEIVSLVEASRNLEKVVIKVPHVCTERVHRFYNLALACYFDEDDRESNSSNCYEFTNEVGKCLTIDEFKVYWFLLEA